MSDAQNEIAQLRKNRNLLLVGALLLAAVRQ